MAKLLRRTRSKPQVIHRGSAPRHLRKSGCTVTDLYRAYGLRAHTDGPNSTSQRTSTSGSASAPVPNHYITSQSFLHGSRLDPTLHQASEDKGLGQVTYKDGTTCTVLEYVATRRINRIDSEFVEAARKKYGDDIDMIFSDLSLNQMQFTKREIQKLFNLYDDVKKGGTLKLCTDSVLNDIRRQPEPSKSKLDEATTMTIEEANWISKITQRLRQDT
ncbi:Ribosome biogenesis protein Nop16 [Giardia muris]|uniref:Ribosome biogenesis protein Nop16 n=1 Tax=Giardia muris TaxID=5742 RepID=A0A4Z1TBH8_GIAMU|nr:Ribosome biogenesis protein Nop16 [Giardia muris]|eukprot:TNJ29881.1 Ribosome biogenesis protein Nop16 [Giardia muris]